MGLLYGITCAAVRASCFVRRFRMDLVSYLVMASIAAGSYVVISYILVVQFELHTFTTSSRVFVRGRASIFHWHT